MDVLAERRAGGVQLRIPPARLPFPWHIAMRNDWGDVLDLTFTQHCVYHTLLAARSDPPRVFQKDLFSRLTVECKVTTHPTASGIEICRFQELGNDVMGPDKVGTALRVLGLVNGDFEERGIAVQEETFSSWFSEGIVGGGGEAPRKCREPVLRGWHARTSKGTLVSTVLV